MVMSHRNTGQFLRNVSTLYFFVVRSRSTRLYRIQFHNFTLTLSQTTNFRLLADHNFNFDENARKFFKPVENTVGKGEIARLEKFLLFSQCFQNTYTAGT